MSFANEVESAIDEAEKGAETEPAKHYLAVLDEFVRGLSSRGVGARITPLSDPRKVGLHLFPRHQPQRGSLMLTFFFSGDAVVVSGESPIHLTTPAELEDWLLKFIKLPAFIESLRVLREAAAEPVEARLRVSANMAYAKGDVVVVVAPADQERLARAKTGDVVELEVARVEFPGNAIFSSPPQYALLDSAGLIIEVDSANPSGDKLKVSGRRTA